MDLSSSVSNSAGLILLASSTAEEACGESVGDTVGCDEEVGRDEKVGGEESVGDNVGCGEADGSIDEVGLDDRLGDVLGREDVDGSGVVGLRDSVACVVALCCTMLPVLKLNDFDDLPDFDDFMLFSAFPDLDPLESVDNHPSRERFRLIGLTAWKT
jgi:hypothetical protein